MVGSLGAFVGAFVGADGCSEAVESILSAVSSFGDGMSRRSTSEERSVIGESCELLPSSGSSVFECNRLMDRVVQARVISSCAYGL